MPNLTSHGSGSARDGQACRPEPGFLLLRHSYHLTRKFWLPLDCMSCLLHLLCISNILHKAHTWLPQFYLPFTAPESHLPFAARHHMHMHASASLTHLSPTSAASNPPVPRNALPRWVSTSAFAILEAGGHLVVNARHVTAHRPSRSSCSTQYGCYNSCYAGACTHTYSST